MEEQRSEENEEAAPPYDVVPLLRVALLIGLFAAYCLPELLGYELADPASESAAVAAK